MPPTGRREEETLEGVRKRFFSETREGLYQLVACVDEEVVGHLGLETFTRPRRRHVGEIGMAVRDDWQGPKRRIVERTFSWLGRSRRLSKDYERRVQTSECLMEIATIRLISRRLA